MPYPIFSPVDVATLTGNEPAVSVKSRKFWPGVVQERGQARGNEPLEAPIDYDALEAEDASLPRPKR